MLWEKTSGLLWFTLTQMHAPYDYIVAALPVIVFLLNTVLIPIVFVPSIGPNVQLNKTF